jgi:UrcA family protein
MRAKFLSTAIGGLAIAAFGTAAIADQKFPQVRVEATRIVATDVGRNYAGFPVKNIALSYEVSLDDLDLSTSTGLATAEKRINTAAEAACKEIGSAYPESMPADAKCATATARGPLAQLHKAAAATKQAAK